MHLQHCTNFSNYSGQLKQIYLKNTGPLLSFNPFSKLYIVKQDSLNSTPPPENRRNYTEATEKSIGRERDSLCAGSS